MGTFLNSLAGRVFFLLVGGILASAALTLFLADRERHASLEHVRSYHAAERMVQIVTMLEAAPLESRAATLAALKGIGLVAEIDSVDSATEGVLDPALASRLHERLGVDRRVEAVKSPCLRRADDAEPPSSNVALCRTASIALRDGSMLRLALPPQLDVPATRSVPHLALFGLMFAGSLGLLAYAATRMATRPLRLLARAATDLGNNIDHAPLVENGPAEVRNAASAFNLMQAHIKDFILERTQVLAAITHDLQTPLTRLRLRLEKVQDKELRTKLAGDLSAMQDMIRDGLELARSMNSGEAKQRIDFDSLLSSLCDDAVEAGQDVTLEGTIGVSISASPGAIRRCLTNLLDNAVNYGGFARIKASCGLEFLVVHIRDGGPGIPEAQLEKVFVPFFRLEGSRSRETGGTGIGLAIARNIAEQHGGTVFLRNHPQGGLEAVLELPLG